jgi:hypothetical protein
MEREAVFGLVAALVSGPLLVLPNLVRDGDARGTESRERAAWASIWWAIAPLLLGLALLFGWSLREPDPSDEAVSPGRIALALALLLPWGRAAVRAAISLRSPPRIKGAGTVGLLRPRVLVDPTFAESVPPEVLAAALAHERAHAAHFDPLRLWVAQAVTDLQWPLPGPRRRLAFWREALEWARDDDARRAGVRGEDLAAAILAAARIPGSAGTALGLHRPGEALRTRVRRLLAPLPEKPAESADFRWLVPLFVGAVILGATVGDPIVRLIAGGP